MRISGITPPDICRGVTLTAVKNWRYIATQSDAQDYLRNIGTSDVFLMLMQLEKIRESEEGIQYCSTVDKLFLALENLYQSRNVSAPCLNSEQDALLYLRKHLRADDKARFSVLILSAGMYVSENTLLNLAKASLVFFSDKRLILPPFYLRREPVPEEQDPGYQFFRGQVIPAGVPEGMSDLLALVLYRLQGGALSDAI